MKPCNINNKNNLNSHLEVVGNEVAIKNGVSSTVHQSERNTIVSFAAKGQQLAKNTATAARALWGRLEYRWPGAINYPIKERDGSSSITVDTTDFGLDRMQALQRPKLDTNVLYQKTTTNEPINDALEDILKSILKENNVSIISMKKYAKEYLARTGNKLADNVVAAADMIQRTIALSKGEIDGSTLPEEVGHFIEASLRHTNENNWVKLMNHTDENGVLSIEKTKIWEDNFDNYNKLYNGDYSQVKREIIGKIFAQYIKQNFKDTNIADTNPVFRWVSRALQKIYRFFNKQDSARLPDEINKIFGDTVQNFFDSRKLAEDLTAATLTDGNIESDSLANTALKAIQNLRQRRSRILKESDRLRGDIKARYETLKSVHDTTSLIDSIAQLQAVADKTDQQQELLEELLDLFKLDNKFKQEQRDAATLKNLSIQINRLDKQIKAKELQSGLELFLKGVEKKGGGYEGGLAEDIKDVLYDIDQINAGKEELTSDLVESMNEFVEYYAPVLNELQGFITNDFTFDQLVAPKGFEDLVEYNLTRLKRIENFLNKNLRDSIVKYQKADNTLSDGTLINSKFKPEELVEDGQYYDISHWTRWTGGIQHITDPLFGSLTALISKRQNASYTSALKEGNRLLDILTKAKKGLNSPRLKAYMKKHGLQSIEETLMEYADGKPTGYEINLYNLGGKEGFIKKKEEANTRIIDKIEKMAKDTYNIDLHFPRGQDDASSKLRNSLLAGEDIANYSISKKKKKEMSAERRALAKAYSNLWRDWYAANTTAHPALQRKIAERRKQLSDIEYEEWENNSIKVDFRGKVYYTGELSVPSNKYFNTEFMDLAKDKDWKSFRAEFHKSLDESKQKLPGHITSNYANRYLLPQISADFMDKATRSKQYFKDLKGLRGSIAEEIGSGVFSRADDDLYSTDTGLIRADGQRYKNAPIRYDSPLEDVNNISRDLFSSAILYHEMAENYKQFSDSLSEISFLRRAIADRQYKKSRLLGKSRVLIEGEKSQALELFDSVVDAFVFGDTGDKATISIGDKDIDVNKVSAKFVNWVRRVGLQGNIPAILTGMMTTYNKELTTETFIGRHVTKESNNWARKELFSNMGNVTKEFGSPLKTHKMSIFIDRIGLKSNKDRFDNLDKSRITRIIKNVLDFGAWQMADFMPKAQAFLGVADNYRLVKGKWYTKASYEITFPNKKDWSDHRDNSFYNLLEVDGHDVSSSKIGPEQWNIVINKAKRLGSNIDTQPLDIDGAAIGRKYWGRFLLTFRGWMYQGIQRRAKGEHFNRFTNEEEVGYYLGTWQAFNQIFGGLDAITSLQGYTNNWNNLSPAQREGVLKTTLDIVYAFAFYLMAYVVNSLAADDEDDASLQLAGYISTRLVMESSAFLGVSDLTNLVTRPVAGVDTLGDLNSLLGDLATMFNIWGEEVESKVISKGAYKGKTAAEKRIIRLLPGIRGLYETLPISTDYNNPAESLFNKNKYIKNKVIGTPSIFDPVILIPNLIAPLKDAGKKE